jgi:hypothetical protein
MSGFGPWLFGSFALVHGSIAVLALTLMPSWPLVALPLALVEAVTAYDNLVIVMGRSIGITPRAIPINRARFFLHAAVIGLLVPVYVGIGAQLDVALLASDLGLAAGFAAAAAIAVFGYAVQFRSLGGLMPSNHFGCLRYVQAVDERRRYPGYDYSEDELAQRGLPPFASIITVLIGLGVALWIGVAAGFWVPFIVTAIMFAAAGLPPRSWGPLATSALEIVFSGGLLWSVFAVVGK